MTAVEAAGLLGISLRAFHKSRLSMPPPVSIGLRLLRWRREDLIAWAASLDTIRSRGEPEQLARGRKARQAGDESVRG
jgi:predicted DNA-binding transcriptional regulator AlpA